MPTLNIINCKTENTTKIYIFVSSIFCKNSTNSNIYIFEDLNIIQISID